jgi:hypothetical protein
MDENHFFGNAYEDASLKAQISNLRNRVLPERALVLTPRALCDKESHTAWFFNYSDFVDREDPVARRKASSFFNNVKSRIHELATASGAKDLGVCEIAIDIPDPPRVGKLGQETMIQMVPGCVVNLSDLFPFHKVVNNYSIQYKYRTYVFGPERWGSEVAYAAFRAFTEAGIKPNDLALILAHKDEGPTRDLLNYNRCTIPDWRKAFFTPDKEEEQLDINRLGTLAEQITQATWEQKKLEILELLQ